jgi:hypothetical protein
VASSDPVSSFGIRMIMRGKLGPMQYPGLSRRLLARLLRRSSVARPTVANLSPVIYERVENGRRITVRPSSGPPGTEPAPPGVLMPYGDPVHDAQRAAASGHTAPGVGPGTIVNGIAVKALPGDARGQARTQTLNRAAQVVLDAAGRSHPEIAALGSPFSRSRSAIDTTEPAGQAGSSTCQGADLRSSG